MTSGRDKVQWLVLTEHLNRLPLMISLEMIDFRGTAYEYISGRH
jgi:hypothetical protein